MQFRHISVLVSVIAIAAVGCGAETNPIGASQASSTRSQSEAGPSEATQIGPMQFDETGLARLTSYRTQIDINVIEWLQAYAEARFVFNKGSDQGFGQGIAVCVKDMLKNQDVLCAPVGKASGSSSEMVFRLFENGFGAWNQKLKEISPSGDKATITAYVDANVRARVKYQVRSNANAKIMDDGDAGFAAAGWILSNREGFQKDMRWLSKGTGKKLATYIFAVTPGKYHVAAVWAAGSKRASNTPFEILDGAKSLSTVRMNQKAAPDSFLSADGMLWQTLSESSEVSSGTLTVRISDNANGDVVADGIRIEKLP